MEQPRDLQSGAWRGVNALRVLLALDPVLPLNFAAVLLYVASQGETTVQDIQKACAMPSAAAARAVQRLSDGSTTSDNVGKGLGLLVRTPDPKENRRFLYKLSEQGEAAVRLYVSAMDRL